MGPLGVPGVPGVPKHENFAILNFTVSLGSKLTAKLKKWLYRLIFSSAYALFHYLHWALRASSVSPKHLKTLSKGCWLKTWGICEVEIFSTSWTQASTRPRNFVMVLIATVILFMIVDDWELFWNLYEAVGLGCDLMMCPRFDRTDRWIF